MSRTEFHPPASDSISPLLILTAPLSDDGGINMFANCNRQASRRLMDTASTHPPLATIQQTLRLDTMHVSSLLVQELWDEIVDHLHGSKLEKKKKKNCRLLWFIAPLSSGPRDICFTSFKSSNSVVVGFYTEDDTELQSQNVRRSDESHQKRSGEQGDASVAFDTNRAECGAGRGETELATRSPIVGQQDTESRPSIGTPARRNRRMFGLVSRGPAKGNHGLGDLAVVHRSYTTCRPPNNPTTWLSAQLVKNKPGPGVNEPAYNENERLAIANCRRVAVAGTGHPLAYLASASTESGLSTEFGSDDRRDMAPLLQSVDARRSINLGWGPASNNLRASWLLPIRGVDSHLFDWTPSPVGQFGM
ncbi:hypothetical protein B0H14DRAFT_2584953 [Mycena olivaceomarginata]|nr:hypothetical protein B0H14DRAFT_2584953 [Mycena olivaceomarginata]